jgi:phosphoglycerate dehydrogenase-like enzyme
VFRECKKLKFFQIWGAGFEYLPTDLLGEMGVTVSNNGGTNSIAVAETAITLMLCVYRNLEKQWQGIDRKIWRRDLDPTTNHEITGKTVGIIGLGHIGKDVAQRLNGWAGRLLYFDVLDVPKAEEKRLGVQRVPMETLLKESDIVTVHVPYNKHTHHLMGEKQFAMMKPTAVFINTCRGAVTDEPALIAALKNKTIAAAGLDVFEKEPVQPDNPLLDMPNVFPLPHRAGASVDTFRRSAVFGFENILRVKRGEPPLAQVFPPVKK